MISWLLKMIYIQFFLREEFSQKFRDIQGYFAFFVRISSGLSGYLAVYHGCGLPDYLHLFTLWFLVNLMVCDLPTLTLTKISMVVPCYHIWETRLSRNIGNFWENIGIGNFPREFLEISGIWRKLRNFREILRSTNIFQKSKL